jgi:prepilin-type N-terminal cleavage/methylation domain-containing protein
MAQSPFSKKTAFSEKTASRVKIARDKRGSRGFTIIEVLVASVILLVGLVAAAGVVGATLGNTSRSEYMTQAATLATEKLEDLNRFPSTDANIAVTSGTSSGSLTSDDLQNVTVNGATQAVNYYDEVYFSPAEGALQETTTSFDANGNVQYSTISYTPDGTMSQSAFTTTPPSGAGSISFKRRWVIDLNQPVTGVRRITVLVTLQNQSVQPPVTFQMSMVRP